MPKQTKKTIDEKSLTKGQIRKLTALRKSLGQEIADKAFLEWLDQYGSEKAEPEDQNVNTIVEILEPLVKGKKLKIPRGGYLVRRGRGRVIVERAKSE